METTRCVYHGWVWNHLADRGWVTAIVLPAHPEGHRIAIMVKP